MNEQQELVSDKKVRKDTACAVAFDDFVHRVGDSFEALKALDTADDGGLRNVDRERASSDLGGNAIPDAARGVMDEDGESDGSCSRADDKAEEQGKQDASGTAAARRGGIGHMI